MHTTINIAKGNAEPDSEPRVTVDCYGNNIALILRQCLKPHSSYVDTPSFVELTRLEARMLAAILIQVATT